MPYYFRLDDACEKRDIEKWGRMEDLLDKYKIRPLVGIIPKCEDTMMDKYTIDPYFWEKVDKWVKKDWVIALHGYNHVCISESGGMNPVNYRSEFAGVPLDIQKEKIIEGIKLFKEHGIEPRVFFAPSHTFDENTITALIESSTIRIISDTIANKPYKKYGITFVPQQSGSVRKLPLNTITFCYHPNIMLDSDFVKLDEFFKLYKKRFKQFPLVEVERKRNFIDVVLQKAYFVRRK